MNINGTWELIDHSRADATVAVLTIDVNRKTGTLQYLQRANPLSGIVQTSATTFRATYAVDDTFGKVLYQGLIRVSR
jgi:hypothetical protein